MNKISLSFSELNTEQAELLLKAYSEITGAVPSPTENVTVAMTDVVAPAPTVAQPTTPIVETQSTVPTPAPVPQAVQDVVAIAAEAELDKFGVPWHAEVHASTKKQKADGSWTRRKNSDKAAGDAYEAEHRAAYAAAAAQVTATPEASGALPFETPVAPTPVAAPVPTPAPAAIEISYEDHLLPLWTQLNAAAKLPMTDIDGIMDAHKAGKDYTQIATNPVIRGEVYNILSAVQ